VHIFMKSEISLGQTKNKLIFFPSYTYCQIHITITNALFCDICVTVCQSHASHAVHLLSVKMP